MESSPPQDGTSDINRNQPDKKVTVVPSAPSSPHPSFFCAECSIKFESGASLEVHRAYHQSSLLCRWAAESPPPPRAVVIHHPAHPPPPPAEGGGGGGGETAVESPPVRSPVSSGSGPAVRPGSMQISMAQSMAIQQGAPPHLTSHHTSPIFPSPEPASEEASPATPTLPSINADVSEFFSQLEGSGDPSSANRQNGSVLENFPEEKDSGRAFPESGGFPGGQAGGQQYSSTYPAMEAAAVPGYSGPGAAGDFLGFGEPSVSTHDQSSEEIWDMDAHTVRRYNPVPDPVSPGPIPTTPTMYGMGQGASYPYGRSGGLAPPLSPGLVPSPWGPMGMKGHASLSEAKRPKTYQCEACDKW